MSGGDIGIYVTGMVGCEADRSLPRYWQQFGGRSKPGKREIPSLRLKNGYAQDDAGKGRAAALGGGIYERAAASACVPLWVARGKRKTNTAPPSGLFWQVICP